MIENPQVGQRVVWVCGDASPIEMEVKRLGRYGEVILMDLRVPQATFYADREELYDSPASAASALRAEAQRLLDAADKLESEASDG